MVLKGLSILQRSTFDINQKKILEHQEMNIDLVFVCLVCLEMMLHFGSDCLCVE